MAKLFLHTCALLVLCVVIGCGSKSVSLIPATSSPASVTPTVVPVAFSAPSLDVDSPAGGFTYAYAPSIIYTQGAYHMYFCSTGSHGGWDDIRYETSSDLIHWSAPDTVLVPSAYERSNCDPSVVFNQADGYFYLYYGGNVPADQTVVFVARSQNPDGPFLKWSGSTWEANPVTTAIVIAPVHPDSTGKYYGAGQPTVVIRGGVFYMWWSDDTDGTRKPGYCNTYMATSFDGINWTQRVETNLANGINTVDVKWDASADQFVMINVAAQYANASVVMYTSADGITWSDTPQVLIPAGQVPAGANNPGISGDETGALMSGETLIAYGAPYVASQVNPATGIAGVMSQADIWGNLMTSSAGGGK
jgi:hypothetical protein